MNTIEIFLTSVGENESYTQNFSFAELIKDFPVYQYNYQNIVLNINIPTSILPDGYEIAGVTTDTMGAAVKVSASSLARNGAIRQSKSFYLRYLKTWTKDNVEYAMFQRPFPQTFALYAGQGENAPKLTINVVNIMNDTLEDPNPTVVSVITSQICSLEVMPSTLLDKDAELDPSDLDEINARLSSIEAEQLIQNANINTNAEDIDSLEERVGTNEDNIEDLQDKVEALGGTPFTNEELGLILGSSDNGKISANEDGTGSVNGFDSALGRISTNEIDIANIKSEQTTQNTNIQNNTTSIGALSTRIGNTETDIDNIEAKIPTQASSSNQLADKDFVNSSINAFAAFYITKNAQGDPFATKAELNSATVFYSGGVVRVPTTNDYCIVLADESQQSSTGVAPTTRYSYQGNQWEFQYKINDTPLTAAQLATLNSGLTSADKTKLDGIEAGAEVNVQADWNQTDSTADDFIKNKPYIPAGVVVDTTLNTSSNNAIANSAVANAVNNLQSTKQDKLSTAQQNAVDSGIDSTKVAQIATNASNITNLQNNKVNLSGYDLLDNMNEYVYANKTYYYNSTTTNKPTESGSDGIVQYIYGGDSIKLNQIVYPRGTSYFFMRTAYSALGWDSWKRYSSDNYLVDASGYGRLADMNYVEAKNKTYYYDNQTTNQPNNETWWGTVQYVYGRSGNYVTQIVYRNDANYFYKRLYYTDGRGWQAWEKYYDNNPTAWQYATPNTTTLYSGTCEFCKVGKIVYCYIDGLVVNSGISGSGSGLVELFTGLPTTNHTIIFILPQQTGGNSYDIRCKLEGGTISLHWTDTASFGDIGKHHNLIFSYVEA